MKLRTTVAAAAMSLLMLTSCSSGDDTQSETGGESADREVAPEDGAAEDGAADEAAPGDSADSPNNDEGSGGVIGQAVLDSPERSIVHTFDLSIRADDVAGAAQSAASVATDAGGLVADEQMTDDGTATLTLRVPNDAHTSAVQQLEELGEVTDKSHTTEDVTQEIVDTDSRVSSQRASIDRIRGLLNDANELSDVITIESELASREADLDALLTKQDRLAGQAAMATITVSLHATEEEPVDEEDDTGFLAGLSGGWDTLASAGGVGLTAAGAVLPFAVLAGLIVVPSYILIRRRIRRHPMAEPEAQAPVA